MGLMQAKSVAVAQKCSCRKRLFEYLWNRFCKLMLFQEEEKEDKPT